MMAFDAANTLTSIVFIKGIKALRKLMLSLRRTKHMRMGGAVESDEVYVTACLKGRNNSRRIKRIGRKPRRRGSRRRGSWREDKPQSSSSLREVVEKTTSPQKMLSPKHPSR
jgi:hypothetical protein